MTGKIVWSESRFGGASLFLRFSLAKGKLPQRAGGATPKERESERFLRQSEEDRGPFAE
jgi:hypothetical protein